MEQPAPARSSAPPAPADAPAQKPAPRREEPAPTLASNLAAAAVSLSAAAEVAAASEKKPAAKSPPPRQPAARTAPQPAPAKSPAAPETAPLRADRATPPRRSSHAITWLILLVLAAVAGYFAYTHFFAKDAGTTTTTGAGAHGGHHGADLVRVVTAVAATSDIPVYITGLGAVTPLNTVTVQSRVSGQLMKVLYTEGQMVKAGDLLLQIDARPYQAQLEQDNAQKEHDQALLENAQVDLQRYQTLWAQDSIPQQTLATQEATVKQDQATVDTDQALIDQTQLNITYCNITSPIDGRVGLRLVDVGNYVQATSSSGLVVITQIQPITVIFTIPEDSIDAVVTPMRAGQTLPVDAYTRGGFTHKLATGTLLTLDNQIDPSTGTVKLRATFPNLDDALFPNQFVNTRMQVDTRTSVVTVPVAAVQHGANNSTFVYLVDTDADTVKLQTVQTGAISFDGATEEIKSGVEAGDTVVTDGVDKLTDGAKVVIAKPAAANADSSGTADGAASSDASGSGNGGSGQHHHHHKKQPPSGDTNAAPAP